MIAQTPSFVATVGTKVANHFCPTYFNLFSSE